MKTQSKITVLTVANATALITAVVTQVSGNEVANTLNGSPINGAALSELIATEVHAHFSNSKGVQS